MKEQHKTFAIEYIKNGRNGTRAAIAAGYSERTAYSQASQILRRDDVAAYIKEESRKIYERNKMEIDEAISILTDIGRTTIRDFYNEDGTLKSFDDMPPAALNAIEEVEYTTAYVWDEITETRTPVQVPHKIKISGKQAAIDKALRHLGGYKVDNEQKRPEPIVLNINPLSDEAINEEDDLT